jgi:hypothetical protein
MSEFVDDALLSFNLACRRMLTTERTVRCDERFHVDSAMACERETMRT